jgi:hypothetical protein
MKTSSIISFQENQFTQIVHSNFRIPTETAFSQRLSGRFLRKICENDWKINGRWKQYSGPKSHRKGFGKISLVPENGKPRK